MNKSFLVKILGFTATLIHGDTLVLDRWLWLKRRMPLTKNGEKVLDIGCGTGAFSIGASLRGYEALGLSWDSRNQTVANERAKACKARSTEFQVLDVRHLGERTDLFGKWDLIICTENIEHIIDDMQLFKSMSSCLRPGGRLLLTTPYLLYRSITPEDNGPFSEKEDGGHVRRGYTKSMLEELCVNANLLPERVSYCSGFFSQKITTVFRKVSKIHPLLGWAIVLPLRILPPILDDFVFDLTRWPHFCICLEAIKPRFSKNECLK